MGALLADAERVDSQEDERFGPDRRGDELPERLQRREQRLQAIREAKAALEAEAAGHERARRGELAAQGKAQGAARRAATRTRTNRARNATSPIPSRSS